MIGADAAFFPEEHFKLQSDTSGALMNEALNGDGRAEMARRFVPECSVLAEQERLRSIYTERWINPLAMANHLQ